MNNALFLNLLIKYFYLIDQGKWSKYRKKDIHSIISECLRINSRNRCDIPNRRIDQPENPNKHSEIPPVIKINCY